MKAVSILFAALLAVGAASAHDASTSLTPSAAAVSTSQTSAFAGTGGGLSISGAANQQAAGVSGAQSGAAGSALFNTVKFANVGVAGQAGTSTQSVAGNLSLGDATGSALATGASTASIVGAGAGHTVNGGPLVSVSGNAEAVSGSTAQTGRNGLAITGGTASSGFDAHASATQVKFGSTNNIDVSTGGLSVAAAVPGATVHIGSGSVQLQNEAAANAFGQARVGNVVSTN